MEALSDNSYPLHDAARQANGIGVFIFYLRAVGHVTKVLIQMLLVSRVEELLRVSDHRITRWSSVG